jgi:hypothetical protein
MYPCLRFLHLESAAHWQHSQEFNGVVFSEEEGTRLAAALGPKGKGLILRNHGLLTVGGTVDEACYLYTLMERSCQVQLLAEAAAANGLPKVYVPDEAARYTFEAGSDPETLYWEAQPDMDWEAEMCGGRHAEWVKEWVSEWERFVLHFGKDWGRFWRRCWWKEGIGSLWWRCQWGYSTVWNDMQGPIVFRDKTMSSVEVKQKQGVRDLDFGTSIVVIEKGVYHLSSACTSFKGKVRAEYEALGLPGKKVGILKKWNKQALWSFKDQLWYNPNVYLPPS